VEVAGNYALKLVMMCRSNSMRFAEDVLMKPKWEKQLMWMLLDEVLVGIETIC